jgi:hypothetical protein
VKDREEMTMGGTADESRDELAAWYAAYPQFPEGWRERAAAKLRRHGIVVPGRLEPAA